MTGRTLPAAALALADPTTSTAAGFAAAARFDSSACLDDDHKPADHCTCTPEGGCGEGSEAGCCWCVHSDPYEPCPVVGFICGSLPDSEQCNCCTPQQFAASRVAYRHLRVTRCTP